MPHAMPTLLESAEAYVTRILSDDLEPRYRYHNLRHTQRVVERTVELSGQYSLQPEQEEDLLLAAWFHDTGYTLGSEEHEESSCRIARDFLSGQGMEPGRIGEVCSLILATRRFYEPGTLSEEILRDADASHLSRDSYRETSETLREELHLLGQGHFGPEEWLQANIEMFEGEHRYYTDYALNHWQEGKDRNLAALRKEQKKRARLVKKEQMKARFKSESPERGIQTLYRVSMRNHLKLSDIADTKANILLSVNAIIISLVISNLIPKFDNPANTYLLLPTFMFLAFSITSMVLSILATRPNITSGSFSRHDVEERKVNLLFFGNFHKMPLPEYRRAMQELITDKEYVYDSLTMDLYYLGVVLNRKYRLLRWTYTTFMLGMILSVAAFFLALEYFGPGRLTA